MYFVLELQFTDNPARLAARPAHRDLLTRLNESGEVLIAGPWHDDSGAHIILRCNRQRVEEIMATDPYYTTDGVTIRSLRQWNPIVGV